MQPLLHFVAGAVFGAIAAVVGLYFGFISAIAAIAIVTGAGLVAPKFAVLSGGLTAIGITWLLLALNSLTICAGTEGFCGNANFVPMLAVSIAISLVGVSLAAWTIATANRRSESR